MKFHQINQCIRDNTSQCRFIVRILLILFLPLWLVACGGGGSSTSVAPSPNSTLAGSAHKGAFIIGSNVTAYSLDAAAQRSGNTTTTTTLDNRGSYELTLSWAGWTEVEIQGQFFDEYNGTSSSNPLTLRALINTSSEGNRNVNLMTHLVVSRIRALVASGASITNADTQARGEMKTLLSLNTDETGSLNPYDGSGSNASSNAVLLLFSGSFLAAGGDTTMLQRLATDFADDGLVNGAGQTDFVTIGNKSAEPGMMQRLSNNVSSTGESDPPTSSDLDDSSPPEWVNETPIANTITASTAEDTAKDITLSGSDVEGSDLTYAKASDPEHGTVSINASTGIATYSPAANYNGNDSFTFKVNDGTSDSSAATVSIEVTAVNDVPTASTGITATTAEDTAKDITLSGSDIESSSLTYTKVSDPAHGTVTINASTGVATYTPATNYNGNDSFTFKVNDGTSNSTAASVSIEVTAVNDAPTASTGITATTAEDTAKDITLSGNDIESSSLTYAKASDPAHGTVSINASTGVATYTPALNYNGSDSFTFKVNDGTSNSAAATVSIEVTAVNDTPTASTGITTSTAEDTEKDIALSGSDIEGSDLTYLKVSDPAHGTVSINASTGVATYTPAPNYNGSDSFTFKVNDGTSDSAAATVSITVTAVNDAPSAGVGDTQVADGGATVNLSGSGFDIENDTLSYSWVQTSGSSTITLTNANTATASFTAPMVTEDTTFTFRLTVSDGHGGSESGTAYVLVRNAVVQPSVTNRLNDTGITTCGDYSYGFSNNPHNNVNCSLSTDTNTDPVPPTIRTNGAGQDGHVGRDANADTNNNTDGHAGFHFTKIGADGKAFADQSALYTDTPWHCVKDEVTGLIWEVKTDDNGLHDQDWSYTWYSTVSNGGTAGTSNGGACNDSQNCDTSKFVTKVNAAGWCGANDWRMPTREELRSIANLGRHTPAIDTDWFPNTKSEYFWSSSLSRDSTRAWCVNFTYGSDDWIVKSNPYRIRLVRGGQ